MTSGKLMHVHVISTKVEFNILMSCFELYHTRINPQPLEAIVTFIIMLIYTILCTSHRQTSWSMWPTQLEQPTHSSVSVINVPMYQRLIKPRERCLISYLIPTKGNFTDTYRPEENMGSLFFYAYLVDSLIVIHPRQQLMLDTFCTSIVNKASHGTK